MIEDAVMDHPDRLGFPGALAIRNCRVALPAGRVDVMLLPESGDVEIVLVEAKVSSAGDAASKVIGQLLMYYAGALELGSNGLKLLRDFAREKPEIARTLWTKSPKLITGGISPPALAWQCLYKGTQLMRDKVRLFIALDGESHRALTPTLSVLRQHHGLNIGVVVVREGIIQHVHAPG